jgi:hypothetical protein
MKNPAKTRAEVDAARAALHSAVDCLVAMIRDEDDDLAGGAAGAVLELKSHISDAAAMALHWTRGGYQRTCLVSILRELAPTGYCKIHDVLAVLSRIATSDPDEEVRSSASNTHDVLLRRECLEWEELGG